MATPVSILPLLTSLGGAACVDDFAGYTVAELLTDEDLAPERDYWAGSIGYIFERDAERVLIAHTSMEEWNAGVDEMGILTVWIDA